MMPEEVKTSKSDKPVTIHWVDDYLNIGIESLRQLINNSATVRHLKF